MFDDNDWVTRSRRRFYFFLRNSFVKGQRRFIFLGSANELRRFKSKGPGWLICLTRLRRDWYGWLMVRRGDVY